MEEWNALWRKWVLSEKLAVVVLLKCRIKTSRGILKLHVLLQRPFYLVKVYSSSFLNQTKVSLQSLSLSVISLKWKCIPGDKLIGSLSFA
jgi:hypothetical protein